MSAQSDSKESKGAEEEEGGGLLPAIVVGAGILVVAALLIFDFGDDKETTGDRSANAARAGEPEGGGARSGNNKGGVQSRPYDPAEGPKASKRNPAIKLPNVGMAPAAPAPPEEPPEFASTAEKIAWYEKKLAGAIKIRDARKKYVERLPKVKERIEAGPNPEEGLASFEGRKKIVEDNFDSAQKKVEEIEAKLAELRG